MMIFQKMVINLFIEADVEYDAIIQYTLYMYILINPCIDAETDWFISLEAPVSIPYTEIDQTSHYVRCLIGRSLQSTSIL